MSPHSGGWYRSFGKRTFDASTAAVGLALLSPLLALLALGSVVSQGRPIFFSQMRIGRLGKPFPLIKLRTMQVSQGQGSSITVRGDTRITPWGRWLRRFKLDELPQLWCVLKGDMSFVGPRPDVPGYWDQVGEGDRDLLGLRPGITSPATLVFRNEEALLENADDPIHFNDAVLFPEKVRLARCYAESLSFVTDLKCILLTFAPEPILNIHLTRAGWTSSLDTEGFPELTPPDAP